MTDRARMQKRADEIGSWLGDNAPYIAVDQKHLDEASPERAYWHYGYRQALLDVLGGGPGEGTDPAKEE